MEKWTLPNGWHWLPLSTVAEDTDRRNPTLSPDAYFTYVDIASINNDRGVIDDDLVKLVKGSDAPSRARKVIRKGNIIFATTRPYLKNVAIVPERYDNQICSTGFCVLSAKAEVGLPEYIFFATRSAFFIDQMIPKQRGANYPAVSDGDVFATEIPIPYPDDPARSLAEQRRIVARLEALLGEAREMRQLQAEIEGDLGRLMGAVLAEVFPDPTGQVPSGWIVKEVGEISRPPQYGYTQSARSEPVGPRFLRITDIQNGLVDWSSVPYCECTQAAFKRYQLFDGDIVFARSGATTGKTFLVKNPPDAVFASYLIRLRIVSDASPDFVYWFFQSPYYWKQIVLRGGAQPNMNAQVLRSVRVPILTNPSAQSELVARLHQYSLETAEMRAVSAANTAWMVELERSILDQAFRGEL